MNCLELSQEVQVLVSQNISNAKRLWKEQAYRV